jgi:hypothetical protein
VEETFGLSREQLRGFVIGKFQAKVEELKEKGGHLDASTAIVATAIANGLMDAIAANNAKIKLDVEEMIKRSGAGS